MKIEFLRPSLVALLFVISVLTLSLPAHAQQQQLQNDAGPTSPHSQSGSVGRYYALVIGNQTYASLPNLKTAEADARAVDALLREFYGFETKLLLNATRQQMVWAIHSYRQTLAPDANLLIYYAGHGMKDAEAEKAYWLPVDAARDDPSNWIIADEITTRIKVIPARHVLIVSDSCYSGTMMRGILSSLPVPKERDQFLRRMMAGRSRTLMASGGDEPVADGGGGNHSVFANALLRGLREMDKDGFTASELFRGHVEESVAGRAHQMPEYQTLRNSGHESGDFVFVRSRTNDKHVGEATRDTVTTVEASVLESEFWKTVESSGDPEEYRRYLTKYPDGQFAATARQRATGAEVGGRGGAGNDAATTRERVDRNNVAGASASGATDARASKEPGETTSAANTSTAGVARQPQPARNGKSPAGIQSPVFDDRREQKEQGQPRQSPTARDAETYATRREPAPGHRP